MEDGCVTVGELIEILSKYPKDLRVMYNIDSYGLLGIYPENIGINQYMVHSGTYEDKFEDAVIITE